MIERFREHFSENLQMYRQQIAASPFLLSLLDPFYGLSDSKVYDQWKLQSDMNYFEASNLVHAMKEASSTTEALKELAEDLQKEGYDSRESADFDKTKVEEQLALVSAVLSDRFGQVLEQVIEQEKKSS